MISFKTELHKYDKKGEKTGWTYVDVTALHATKLNRGVKKSFRVKGTLDDFEFKLVALIPIGDGDFILPVNQTMRKALGKKAGDHVIVNLELDKEEYQIYEELIICLQHEPAALTHFLSLTRSHQNYYSKWVETARTDVTRADRIGKVLYAMLHKMDYGAMIRHFQNK